MGQRYVGRGALLGYGPCVAVDTSTSTGTDIPNHGIRTFGSTAAKTWQIAKPKVGQSLVLYCSAGSGTAVQTVSRSGITFVRGGSTAAASLKFTAKGQAYRLTGYTTAAYLVEEATPSVPKTAVTSTGVKLPTVGVANFGSTAGAKSWNLAAPVVGQSFTLYALKASTGRVQKVWASTGGAVTFGASTVYGSSCFVASFNHNYEYIQCMPISSAIIVVTSNGGVTFSTA